MVGYYIHIAEDILEYSTVLTITSNAYTMQYPVAVQIVPSKYMYSVIN